MFYCTSFIWKMGTPVTIIFQACVAPPPTTNRKPLNYWLWYCGSTSISYSQKVTDPLVFVATMHAGGHQWQLLHRWEAHRQLRADMLNTRAAEWQPWRSWLDFISSAWGYRLVIWHSHGESFRFHAHIFIYFTLVWNMLAVDIICSHFSSLSGHPLSSF